ncbi:NDR1/HIN1-like protein 10 [Papaver somniferum]|uniref:NDR1/HIN1-like protein 10 n=1 Tax=Papaver somniferum TaxID=3469 RepID=UPI000E7058A2|nr:NDR1/HIN1-like protein 10 [Papaver somniferum]
MGDFCYGSCFLVICRWVFGLLILMGGIVCIVVFLEVLPYDNMKFHVIDASLSEFYLTNDDILHYNVAVNISVRNSNKVERISYRAIRSNPSCYGKDLASISLPSFWQGTKNTTLLHFVFQGQTSVKLRGSHLRDFNYDRRDGIYSIYVYLYLITRLKYAGGGKSGGRDTVVKCGSFRLHLLGSSSSNNQTGFGGLFHTKRCDVYGADN